jgi:hypothetical protein
MLEIKQDPRSPFDQHVTGSRTGKIYFTGSNSACIKYIQNKKRNAKARAVNQILRDLTGTSARAARANMGLNSGGY